MSPLRRSLQITDFTRISGYLTVTIVAEVDYDHIRDVYNATCVNIGGEDDDGEAECCLLSDR